MKIFTDASLRERRTRATLNLTGLLKAGDLLLVFSGAPIQKPGGFDQTYTFLPHPDYYWLTGLRRPRGVMAFSVDQGWTEFVLPPTRDEALWEGGGESYAGRDIAELNNFVTTMKANRICLLGQPSIEQSAWATGFTLRDRADIQEALNRARRIKDEAEIALISQCAGFAKVGYDRLQSFLRVGVSERDLQLEYEHEVLRAGAHTFPYDTIVGSGVRSAVLHALPTSRRTQEHELVLIDAGADLHDYGVDITRVYPVSGRFTSKQNDIYRLVTMAQREAIKKCVAGTEWTSVHRTSAAVMADGLVGLGLLRGPIDDLLDGGAMSLFYPHGVGHMVGLRVRDVGGRANVDNVRLSCGVRLRVDLPLENGFLMTVEPGLYFVPALLNDDENRRRYRDQVVWSEVEKWMDFGGIRYEDDILITENGPRNLTEAVGH